MCVDDCSRQMQAVAAAAEARRLIAARRRRQPSPTKPSFPVQQLHDICTPTKAEAQCSVNLNSTHLSANSWTLRLLPSLLASVNPLECNSATSNNLKLVHWPFDGWALAVTFGTAKRELGGAAAVPNVTAHPPIKRPVYQSPYCCIMWSVALRFYCAH